MDIQPDVLVGDRVNLRPLTQSDIGQDYLSWLNDFEVTRYLLGVQHPSSETDIKKYLERFAGSHNDLAFAIIDRQSDLHIGNVTLNHISWVHRTADTGLMIGRKEFWGKGLAFGAWSLIIEYAFQQLGLRKIIAGVIDGNVASLRTLEKLGFKIEGTLRQEVLVDGEHRDVYRLGLFQDEFSSTPTSQSSK